MKLIVSKTAIESAATILSKVIATKNTLPILGSILCEVENNTMCMTASDTQVRMSVPVTLESADGNGRFCVQAQSLVAALGQLAEQQLEITTEDNTFTIKHGSGEQYFPIENADEYPKADTEQYDEALEAISGDMLREALKRTMWATSRDEIRMATTGVSFALNDGWLEIVASDGKVLALSSHDLTDKVKADRIGSFIMPAKVAKILAEVLTGEATIEWNANWGHVSLGQYDICFRLVNATYPPYGRVIPKEPPFTATISRVEILNALRRVLPFATDNIQSRTVRLAFGSDTLKLTGENTNFAMGAHDQITIQFEHPDMKIGVNGLSLITLLTKLEGEKVEIHLTSPDRAVVITPQEQPGKTNITMLAMPLLLSE